MGLPEVWNTKQYEANLRHLNQVMGSRLGDKVYLTPGGFAGGEYKFIDFIDNGEMVEITSRLGNTEWQDPVASRRRIAKRSYEYARIFDKFEKLNRLNDPKSKEMENAVYAVGRKKDAIIIDALGGTAYSGKEGDTGVALPSGQKVDESENLGLASLKATLLIFNENDINQDSEKFLAIGAKQLDSLLGVTQITNADYNTLRVLTEGKVASFMGFKFTLINTLPTSGNDRYCYAWVKDGIELCIDDNMSTTVDRLPEKRNAYGLQTNMTLGAVRTEDIRVVQITCDES